jgi:hypothetical protein
LDSWSPAAPGELSTHELFASADAADVWWRELYGDGDGDAAVDP